MTLDGIPCDNVTKATVPKETMASLTYNVVRNDALWPCGDVDRAAFIAHVWEEGAEAYRNLPWRGVDDAYAVLVSEVMLQQTQVSRVERYWSRFLEAFPTLEALAEGSVADVLALWQGLGYNRRALALKRTATEVVATGATELPTTFDELVALPGIGPATAAGVLAFAYQKPAVYVETNVRAVFLHELFPDASKVPDADLIPYVADTASQTDPRSWYYALLDFGAQLKKSGQNPSRASTTYARQSAFEGSRRQKRAELVRIALKHAKGITLDEAHRALDAAELSEEREAVADDLFTSLIADLEREGFVNVNDDTIIVAE